MNLIERLRRWWRPADYSDEQPLSDQDRDASHRSFNDERGKLDLYTAGGGPIHSEDELKSPRP